MELGLTKVSIKLVKEDQLGNIKVKSSCDIPGLSYIPIINLISWPRFKSLICELRYFI